jgi:glycosyltransferase involved in cell wall biosynthesis
MKRINILFTIDSLINAGTEKSLLETVSRFSNNVNSKVVYFFPRHDLKNEFETRKIPLCFLNSPKRLFFLFGTYKFYRLVKESKPDIVVSSLYSANIISRIVCFITNTTLVGTLVSDSYSSVRADNFTFKQKFGFFIVYGIDRVTSFIPKLWIANSESVKKSNCSKLQISDHKVCVIYRGRDISKFNTFPEYTVDKNFHFITLGRLNVTKGIYDLIYAFKKLTIDYPNIHLDIYGDGPEKMKIKNVLVTENLQEQIQVHGNVADAWKYIYGSNCFVFPSHYEGFSGALVEAMMCGIPIIASDIPMNMEAVESENTALVFKVKSIDDLYLSMKKMVQRYAEMIQMGQRARVKANNHFDIAKIASVYEQKLISLVYKQNSHFEF